MTDYNTKVIETENKLNNHNRDKYIDTQEFNKLAADVFNARLAQANLITKTDFDANSLRARDGFINNNMPIDLKLSKAQLSKIIQSVGFLGSLLSKLAVPLMKVAIPLAKNILAPLGTTAAGIQKKKKWFWNNNFNNFK